MEKIFTREDVDRFGELHCHGETEKFTTFELPPNKGYTAIGNDAFGGLIHLTHVCLPDGIRVIGRRAFCDCKSLKEIVLPDSVEIIREEAFSGCKSLRKVSKLKNLKVVADYAFSGCFRLRDFYFPDCLEKLGSRAFAYTGFWTLPYIPDTAIKGNYCEVIFENTPWIFRVNNDIIPATLCYFAHRKGHLSKSVSRFIH